jgi:4-alpha-glucanotransferase
MKLFFSVDYSTSWGQEVYVEGSIPELHAVVMSYADGNMWRLSMDIPSETDSFTYFYYVKNQEGTVIREWGQPHVFEKAEHVSVYHLEDQWMGIPYNSPFFSSAFTKAFFAPAVKQVAEPQSIASAITFKVFAPELRDDQCLAIVGNNSTLGNWSVKKALLMSNDSFPLWSITLDRSKLKAPFEYKFAVVDPKTLSIEQWENGDNRTLKKLPPLEEALTVTCGVYRGNNPTWKCAGVAIPVFSLRSEESFGIGDFGDLKKMVDWAALTGQRVVQLLPVNDTTMTHTWRDSYPYNANTIFALHPLYLSLSVFGSFKSKETAKFIASKQKELNALPEIDYEAVAEAKWQIYRVAYKEQAAKTLKTAAYKEFVEQNSEWLYPYCVFCYLRDKYQTVDFHQWEQYAVYRPAILAELCDKHSEAYEEVSIHCFLQYHLHCQLKEASDYARSKGVILKGDIPIGVSPNSVEAWTEPHLFNLDAQTGAPPDDFSITGQNWGFPTYNWDQMKQDGFSWWRRRFTKMAYYFDAYRIDHLLGFFRIWEIPMDAVQGLLGHFSPALPMSVQELQANGFWIDEERHVKPYIRYYQLNEMFGRKTDRVIQQYLQDKGSGIFQLKEQFDTQRKIETYFAATNGDSDVRDGLYALVAEVLFVPDPREPQKYHPRITAQYTYSYRALSDSDKHTFDRLYDHFYYQRHNYFWYEQAMQKLPDLITSTDMLVCAEDLGMIPACVPYVMKQLHMLSLEIQRMPKDPTRKFANTNYYPYLSVATTSTHDMSTLRGWWEEDGELRQQYYNQVLGQWGTAPVYAEPSICSNIVRNHLWAPSLLAIFPLQDWLSIDSDIRRVNPNEERINVPANPRHYWRYRMHITLEQLLGNDEYNKKVKALIKETGR